MKKWALLLTLVFCLAFALPFAVAQEALYVPNETTSALFSDAFDSGKAVLLDLNVFASFTDDIAGDSQEARAVFDAISRTLDHAALTLGLCRLEDGLRVELSANYADEAAPVGISAALSLTPDGVALESNLIEGQKMTAKWETLFALAGLSDEQIAMTMSMAAVQPEEIFDLIVEQIDSISEVYGGLLAPYGETISAFIAGLPMELREDVPAEGDFPAVPQELVISLSDRDLAMLINSLANQLEADDALSALLDAFLPQLDAEALASTADLCGLMHALAEEMDASDTVYTIFIGMDENDMLVYLSADVDDGGDSVLLVEFCLEPSESEGGCTFWGDVVTLDAEQYIEEGFGFGVYIASNPDNPNETVFSLGFEAYDDGMTVLLMQADSMVSALTTADGQPGYGVDYTYSYGIGTDDASIGVVMEMNGEMARTAEGGETQNFTGTLEIQEGETSIPTSFVVTQLTTPAQDGPVCEIVYSFSQPDGGLDPFGFRLRAHTGTFDPAAADVLTERALEILSVDEMNALKDTAVTALMQKAAALMAVLPPEIVELIQSSM